MKNSLRSASALGAATRGRRAARKCKPRNHQCTSRCSFAAQSTWIPIGDPTTGISLSDGDTDPVTDNVVSVSCNVYPETDGFHVQASAILGAQGGVTISGHFTANTGDTTLVLQNIDAIFRAPTPAATSSRPALRPTHRTRSKWASPQVAFGRTSIARPQRIR
jgi:hypothetical protein